MGVLERLFPTHGPVAELLGESPLRAVPSARTVGELTSRLDLVVRGEERFFDSSGKPCDVVGEVRNGGFRLRPRARLWGRHLPAEMRGQVETRESGSCLRYRLEVPPGVGAVFRLWRWVCIGLVAPLLVMTIGALVVGEWVSAVLSLVFAGIVVLTWWNLRKVAEPVTTLDALLRSVAGEGGPSNDPVTRE